MSVAELPVPADAPDRTPPNDVAAEQSVLGAMLLSKDAIADVVEVLRENDFYRPSHQVIYGTILDLYTRGEPADAVTVANELVRTAEIGRVGGAPYLHTLVSMVSTAANAGYYGRIVREHAILRRLVEAGTRITQWGYTGAGDVDDMVDMAQEEIYNVTDRRTSEDYLPLSDIMHEAVTEIEAISNRGGEMVGVPTGFHELDQLTNGLHPGQLIIVAARPAIGKALALDTPIPTPTGWTTIGAIDPGDWVLGADGCPARVTAVSPTWADRPCYRVRFSDGSDIVADAAHEWLTDASDGGPAIRETHELAATFRPATCGADTPETTPQVAGLNGAVHRIAAAGPLDLPAIRSIAPPYESGWHGFVPSALLRGSIEQRRALLAGVLDGHGELLEHGRIRVGAARHGIAESLHELITSLGYICSQPELRRASADAAGIGWSVEFDTDDEVFGEFIRQLAHKEARRSAAGDPTVRYVTAVERVASVPVRCIEVDNDSHLFLAGRAMVPTHNSTLGVDIARAASIKHGLTSVIFSLEMSRNEIAMRLLSAEATVPLHHMRSGTMSDSDWERMAPKMSNVSGAPLFIDDSPNMTLMEIRAKCRRLKQREDLRLVIVDYLQLMTSGKRVESRQQEVSEFSRSLKLLAKELGVPVIAISQLNRGPEQRTDKKPMLSDLRESGCLPASTKVVRADTGAEVTLGALVTSGERDVPVWALDDSLRYVTSTMTHAFPTGRKEVFRVRTASGRVVEATANHRMLTYGGWQQLGDLAVGSRIAIPRHVPAPSQETDDWSDDHVEVLARVVGRSHQKFVPDGVFSLPKRQIALFLRHLWATDGSIQITADQRAGRIYYASTSRRLADDVARLLLRFGLTARIRVARKAGYRDGYHVDVSGSEDQTVFLRRIGSHGERGRTGERLLAILQGVRSNTNRDTVPTEVWGRVRATLHDKGMTHREFAAAMGTSFCGSTMWKHAPSRERLGRVAQVLDDAELEMLATNDVYWDEIVAIDSQGEQDVYDATVLGRHNFIADGVVVHNSLEQDADMVILLHREDAYEPESPRAGEADFIVAKHRNGPTRTVTVAFQGHYSRFVDMAQL